MSDALPAMLDAARQALARAHAPYSRFRVGACLRAASGRLHAGCNGYAAKLVQSCGEGAGRRLDHGKSNVLRGASGAG